MGLNKRLFVSQPSGDGIPTDGLLAHYKLDGNANDETGNYNGTAVSGTTYPTGQFGQALDGNGNKYIDLPSGSPFNDSDTIKAVSAWVKLDTSTSRVFPLSISSSSNLSDYWYFGWLADLGRIYVATRNGSFLNQSFAYASVSPSTQWKHIFCQLTSTDREIYLDGVKQTVTYQTAGSGTNTSWITYPDYDTATKGTIGLLRYATKIYSDGLIDQVRLYNRELTSGEISALANEI
jgi:hypothetical protein